MTRIRSNAAAATQLVAAVGLCLLAVTVQPAPASGQGKRPRSDANDKYRAARLKLVKESIEREGVRNERVLEAMRTVPRHRFVPPEQRNLAYVDMALPIGEQQTISPPFIVAYMTEALDPQPEDRVLEIGTGSGYQGAVLAELVKDVYTIEIVESLGVKAGKLFKELELDNVHVKVGDGFLGWPEAAPFDKIIVTCSPEEVPQPLVDQLREGGRLIVPLGERYQQVFYLFEKKDGKLIRTRLLPALFVPMTGQSERERKVKPDPENPLIVNGDFEAAVEGIPEGWYYWRQATLETAGGKDGPAWVRFSNSDPGREAMMLQGLAVDGSKLSTLDFSLWIRAEKIRVGRRPIDKPGLTIQFYDGQRKTCGDETIGAWIGSFEWKQVKHAVRIPNAAREAIIRIGMNGAYGEFGVDGVTIQARRR
jgi:protein-L-isoaspartate(D-aspartate) O-methyltransferase